MKRISGKPSGPLIEVTNVANGYTIGWLEGMYLREDGALCVAVQLNPRVVADLRAPVEFPCCPLDTDGDGNCPVHAARGVLRRPWTIYKNVKDKP